MGRYGGLRHRYLKESKRVLFYQLLTSGKLGYHLEEIDNSANDMLELLVKQMAEKQGVTEKLKADDMMKWVGLMNNIRSAAEEVVLNDLIYA
ncbi:TnpV protein [Aminicella lysinilytica]|uniref:TnpV protein n=1 Tax=Aminicella lysinilytica TaxID=433323 RepID=UPI001FA97D5E|nr:TnpV protein [Aminicella lysinilytica]